MKHYTKADWQWWAVRASFSIESFIELLCVVAIVVASISPVATVVWFTVTFLVWVICLAATAFGFYADIDWGNL